MRRMVIIVLLAFAALAQAQEEFVGGLTPDEFDRYWFVESESPDYDVRFSGDTVEIKAPKGLTLWRKAKMKGDVTIEYDACVVVEREGDRLSDLNCFWMASDPQSPNDLFARASWRKGIFARCYSLQLYYMGYGGNHNRTTRFRRYDGNVSGVYDKHARPAILREYTDSAHLLQPNHWYHVRLEAHGERIRYYIDGQVLVDYEDSDPLREGWFGFRTTLSRIRMANFKYSEVR